MVGMRSVVAPPDGGDMLALGDFLFLFCFFFFFSGERYSQTRQPISTRNSSKDAISRKEVPFGG
jgi:hypothetical protein